MQRQGRILVRRAHDGADSAINAMAEVGPGAKRSNLARLEQIRQLLSAHFRSGRMLRFESAFGLTKDTSVLDLGGTSFNWQFVSARPRLTILNMEPTMREPGEARWVIGDGKYLPFARHAFDVVYSNSVIEHVGDRQSQVRLAEECRRVGRRFYVQTPNRLFPIEPHVLTPFFHWMPRGVQRCLIRNFTVWGWMARPSREYCDRFLEQTNLLSEADLRRLFPDVEIWKERFMGLTKSLIAVRRDA